MKYPRFPQPGDTLGFAAPAFGCTTEPYHTAFLNALKTFSSLGYDAKLGPNVFCDCGIGISNTPALCAAELTDLYCDSGCAAVLSCGGGEMMCEILPHLDWDRLRAAAPRWFMGYSDNTNFTFLLNTILDTASIYGPCAGEFGMEPWHPAVRDAFDLLTGSLTEVHQYGMWEKEGLKDETDPLASYNLTEPLRIRRFPEEDTVFSGRLLGGCIDCLVNLPGTPWDRVRDFNARYAADGVIWFLEACDLNTMALRRAMWQLRQAGWFDTARGFLVGRPLTAGEMFGTDQYAAVLDLVGDLGVPVLMDIDLGHLPPKMPILSGAMAQVTSGPNTVSIRYSLT